MSTAQASRLLTPSDDKAIADVQVYRAMTQLLFAIRDNDISAVFNALSNPLCKNNINKEIEDVSVVLPNIFKDQKSQYVLNFALLFENISIEIIDSILNVTGVDVNITDRFYGATPLIKAASFGRLDIMKSLVSKGANVNKPCVKYKCPPLFTAFMNDTCELTHTKFLIDHKADVTVTYKGKCLISYWVANIVKALLKKGGEKESDKSLLHGLRESNLKAVQCLKEYILCKAREFQMPAWEKYILHYFPGEKRQVLDPVASSAVRVQSVDEQKTTSIALHSASPQRLFSVPDFCRSVGMAPVEVDGDSEPELNLEATPYKIKVLPSPI